MSGTSAPMRRGPCQQVTVLLGVLAVAVSVGRRPPLAAQTAPSVAAARDGITVADFARHLRTLAQDSFQGRTTPSPALDRAALYVAAELQALGVMAGDRVRRPWGMHDDTVFVQRYPIAGRLRPDMVASGVAFETTLHQGGRKAVGEQGQVLIRQAEASFATTARFLGTVMPRQDKEELRPVVLVAGRHTVASLRAADVRGAIVLYVAPAGEDTAARRAVLTELAARAHGVVDIEPAESDADARRPAPTAPPAGVSVADDYMLRAFFGPWAAEVRPDRTLREVLATAGLDVAALPTVGAPVVRALPFMRVRLHVEALPAGGDSVTAPIVVGSLDGRDSLLRGQYIAFVAPFDQDGPGRGAAGDASGIAGLLALARAFSRPEARPRRSLLFLAVSGGRAASWGANFFQRYHTLTMTPVLAIALDRLGGPPDDSLAVDGRDDLKLPVAVPWVAATHPELGIALRASETVFRYNGAHAVFAENGVPTLFAHDGAQDRLAGSTAPDVEQAVARVRLLFHLGQVFGDAESKPQWGTYGRWFANP